MKRVLRNMRSHWRRSWQKPAFYSRDISGEYRRKYTIIVVDCWSASGVSAEAVRIWKPFPKWVNRLEEAFGPSRVWSQKRGVA